MADCCILLCLHSVTMVGCVPIVIGFRVSGFHSELYLPPTDHANISKRPRRRVTGQVVFSLAPDSYKVLWGDEIATVCNTLKYEEGPSINERFEEELGRVLHNPQVQPGLIFSISPARLVI